MHRTRTWIGGLLVGLGLGGSLFAGTIGRQLFITETGRITHLADGVANAFRVCGDSEEQNCPINSYVHPSKGPINKPICSGEDCHPLLEIDSGKTLSITQSDGATGMQISYSEIETWNLLERATDAATPGSGRWKLYFKAGGLYHRDDAGAVVGPLGSGGGTAYPIRPYSAVPVSAGTTFPIVIDGDEMLGVADATTIAADAIWRLGFELPPTLPTCAGGHKLQLDMKANAATGVMRINPKWARWAPGVVRPTSLAAEGVTPASVTGAEGSGDTVTLGTDDGNQLIRIKWVLDGQTVTAGERIAMDLTFENTSTTLAVSSGYLPSIICE